MKKVLTFGIIATAILYSFFAVMMGFVIYNAVLSDQKEAKAKQLATPSVQPPAEKITSDGLYVAINKVRTENGLKPLKRNRTLDKSAAAKCSDMKRFNYYDHINPKTRKKGYTYAQDKGVRYDYASENLNAGMFADATAVLDSWMDSESHAAAILDPQYVETGFATCTIKKYPGETVVVNHLVNPAPAAQAQQYVAPRQNTQPRYDYTENMYDSPEKTDCTVNDYNGWFDPTISCTTY